MAQNEEILQEQEHCEEPVQEVREPEQEAAEETAEVKEENPCAELEKQLAQTKDTLLRTAAEYDNFRKRSQKERDAAFANAQTADEAYKKGVLMTLDKAKAALKALNVEEIEAEGLPFDPQCHAAVMQQPAPEGVESGTILAVMQRGYRRDGKVIRHAAVTVAE